MRNNAEIAFYWVMMMRALVREILIALFFFAVRRKKSSIDIDVNDGCYYSMPIFYQCHGEQFRIDSM